MILGRLRIAVIFRMRTWRPSALGRKRRIIQKDSLSTLRLLFTLSPNHHPSLESPIAVDSSQHPYNIRTTPLFHKPNEQHNGRRRKPSQILPLETSHPRPLLGPANWLSTPLHRSPLPRSRLPIKKTMIPPTTTDSDLQIPPLIRLFPPLRICMYSPSNLAICRFPNENVAYSVGPIYIALCAICLIITIAEIVLLVKRKLTQLKFLICNIIKSTIWTAMFIMDIIAYANANAGRRTTATGLGLDVIIMYVLMLSAFPLFPLRFSLSNAKNMENKY